MVNFGLNSASILGIFLAVAGAGLYFLRTIRPELARDHDIFFAAVGLLCGLILLFQGWRLDPILQFGQFLLTGSVIFFAVETVRLRGVATEQARRNSPIVDDERRVSKTRVYTEAELDQLEPYEDEDAYASNRRLRGASEARGGKSTGYEAEDPRNSRNRRPSSERNQGGETPRKRRPRPSSTPTSAASESWEDSSSDVWEERPATRRPRTDQDPTEESTRKPRKRRPRPASEDIYSTRVQDDSTPTDYVDYQPMDESASDNRDWEQDSTPEERPKRDRKPRNDDDWQSRSEDERNPENPVRFDY